MFSDPKWERIFGAHFDKQFKNAEVKRWIMEGGALPSKDAVADELGMTVDQFMNARQLRDEEW